MQEHKGPITAGLTGAHGTETGSMWPCLQANLLGCCYLPVLCSPTVLCLPVTLCPARGGQQHMTDPRAQFPASFLQLAAGVMMAKFCQCYIPSPLFPASFSFPPWGFMLRPGMMVTSPPRNHQAVAFPLRVESEAAGSKSFCHGADEARRLVCHWLC